MTYDFAGKVALITGAGSGIGLATSLLFAKAGASVVLVDVNESAVRKATATLIADGHKALSIVCDVSNEEQVQAMMETTISTFGRLDAAFNNAGVQGSTVEIADASGEEFERVSGINFRGVWNCMKHELVYMRKQGSGTIVNNSSIAGIVGRPGCEIYHATKHAVLGLTKSAALEYAAQGIRINAICPGVIDTPMVAAMIKEDPEAMKEILKTQTIGRLGKPEEVAEAVLWLSSPGSTFVIGHALVVDGGFTIH